MTNKKAVFFDDVQDKLISKMYAMLEKYRNVYIDHPEIPKDLKQMEKIIFIGVADLKKISFDVEDARMPAIIKISNGNHKKNNKAIR